MRSRYERPRASVGAVVSDVCVSCGHEWFVPDVYFGADQERAMVPCQSASDEEAAREHLLVALTDWSCHEDQRDAVAHDWTHRGIKMQWVCEHPIDEACPRPRPKTCRRMVEAHIFEVTT